MTDDVSVAVSEVETCTINVSMSINEGDFIIWDDCNRFIPISIYHLNGLIQKLERLHDFLIYREAFKEVDPIEIRNRQIALDWSVRKENVEVELQPVDE